MTWTTARNALDEVCDFMARIPNDEELLEYRMPDDLQERLHHLLDLNGEGELSCCQERELEDFLRANRMMSTLSVKIRLRQKGIHA